MQFRADSIGRDEERFPASSEPTGMGNWDPLVARSVVQPASHRLRVGSFAWRARCRDSSKARDASMIAKSASKGVLSAWACGVVAWTWCCRVSRAVDNGVARTPPMGWNSWNTFRCDVSAELVKNTADAIVELGLRDLGYRYVNIDDCWQSSERDEQGHVVPDLNKFPNGMKDVADYVHEKGLYLGIYTDAGNLTCAGYPGSWGNELVDAQDYASWGIDFVKEDWCYMETCVVQEGCPVPVPHDIAYDAYRKMGEALNSTGRPVVFSLCSWGHGDAQVWGKGIGNMWRTNRDLFDVWDFGLDSNVPTYGTSVMQAVRGQAMMWKFAGPGAFNDPDMLLVGLDGMTLPEDPNIVIGTLSEDEQKSHFALWCIMAAPLLVGADVRNLSESALQILRAKEVIAIDQDPLGIQGRIILEEDSLQIWRKPLAGNKWAFLMLNTADHMRDITLSFHSAVPGNTFACESRSAKLRDPWQEKEIGTYRESLTAKHVPPHGHKLLIAEFLPESSTVFAQGSGKEDDVSNRAILWVCMLNFFVVFGSMAWMLYTQNSHSSAKDRYERVGEVEIRGQVQ
eukprot:scaffold177_cov334-Pavlova_lutheri.AAC.26